MNAIAETRLRVIEHAQISLEKVIAPSLVVHVTLHVVYKTHWKHLTDSTA